jgi:hypothetical protein
VACDKIWKTRERTEETRNIPEDEQKKRECNKKRTQPVNTHIARSHYGQLHRLQQRTAGEIIGYAQKVSTVDMEAELGGEGKGRHDGR